jgi:hypothetical protein
MARAVQMQLLRREIKNVNLYLGHHPLRILFDFNLCKKKFPFIKWGYLNGIYRD